MILNGWKEIAAYVRSSVRTVQRWEKAGMPVVRPLASSRGSVIAHSDQLDLWLRRSDSGALPHAPSFHAQIRREDFQQNLALARSLMRQLEATRLQMSMLEAQVALLRQNVTRMKLVGSQYGGERATPPLSLTGVSAPAVVPQRR